jgi:hypothetical protein
MEFASLLALAAVAGGAWFVWDSLKAREAANAAMREACAARGLLFLDDTVSLARLAPARTAAGHLALRRDFRFDYSSGVDRHPGRITLIADRVLALDLDLTADSRA